MTAAKKRTRRRTSVAEVCLYRTRISGFAFLVAQPSPLRIVAKGGWNADETRASGDIGSLDEAVELAKSRLRGLGVDRGELTVFVPGGEWCARTPIEEYQPFATLRLTRAPVTAVTPAKVERTAQAIRATSAARRTRAKRSRAPVPPLELLGTTSSGKSVPIVPPQLAELDRIASAAVGQHGLFDPKSGPAIHASQDAQRAHISSYAAEFTIQDHRDAAKLIADHKWKHSTDMDRHLRYAHNGIESKHREAAEALEKTEREEAWRRHDAEARR